MTNQPLNPGAEPRLHIYYRHVHVSADKRSRDPNKARPAWFSHEACFVNLLETIAADALGHRVTVTVIYDGKVDDLLTDFMAHHATAEDRRVQLQLIHAGSDMNSFLITVSHAHRAAQPPNDIVYFLENDYLHQHGWVSKVFELYASGVPFDLVSLYDHKDKYMLQMYEGLAATLHLSHSHHWRTAPSTCGSFLLSKAALERDFDVICSGKVDYFIFSEIVGARGRRLLTPIPGLATHSMEGYLSPNVDWAALVR